MISEDEQIAGMQQDNAFAGLAENTYIDEDCIMEDPRAGNELHVPIEDQVPHQDNCTNKQPNPLDNTKIMFVQSLITDDKQIPEVQQDNASAGFAAKNNGCSKYINEDCIMEDPRAENELIPIEVQVPPQGNCTDEQPNPLKSTKMMVVQSLITDDKQITEVQQDNASAGFAGKNNGCSKYISEDCIMEDPQVEIELHNPMAVQAPEGEIPAQEGEIKSNVAGNKLEVNNFDTDKSEDIAEIEWEVLTCNNEGRKSPMSYDQSPKAAESSDGEFSFDSDNEEEWYASSLSTQVKPIGKAFDMDLLSDCITKGEKNLCHIEGQDVVLVVGKTGTGKSTLIQGIAGRAFTQLPYTCGDDKSNMMATKDVFDAVDPVPGFEIGHAKSSRTKHIKCYIHNTNSGTKTKMDAKRTSEVVYYLDTPGFEDTEGEEVDIATSAMLTQVIKKCRSMRFIIMINYVSLLDDRGGNIRSVLKFMRNFVHDFDQHKRSFMFLFTHADEINIVPKTLEEARKSLLHEIIFTIEGTKSDDDAKALLSFIRTCLLKDYRFVDVFHPLKTNFSMIAEFVDIKLKPIKAIQNRHEDNEKRHICVLNNSSKMRLIGAIRTLLADLRVYLRSKPVNKEEVCKIQSKFRYFEKYIHFEEMRTAVTECKELIGSHVKELHRIIAAEVKNGTTTSIDSLFSECNVTLIKDSFEQLQAIDSTSFDLEVNYRRITRDVTEFQKVLFLEKTNQFHGFHENLQKLHAWRTLNSECQQLFDAVVSRANEVVQQVMNEVDNYQPSQKSSIEMVTSKLTQIFPSLRVLKSIQENEKSLSLYLNRMSDASQVYDNFLGQLKRYFEALCDEFSPPGIKLLDFKDPQFIQNRANQVRALEELLRVMDESNLLDDISSLVRDVCEQVEIDTVEKFSEACTHTEDKYKKGDNGESLNGLEVLRNAVRTFTFEGMESYYNTVIDGLKSKLKATSGELNEMSHHARQHGVAHGTRDGEVLESFAKWYWFDDFLPQEEQFIEVCLNKIRNDYSNIYTTTANTIDDNLFKLSPSTNNLESPQDLIECTKLLNTKSMEIIELTHFGSIIGDKLYKDRSVQLFNKLHKNMRSRASIWRQNLKVWIELVSSEDGDLKELTGLTKKLDTAIMEISEVINMPSKMGHEIISLSLSIKDEMISAFSNLKQKVNQCLASKITYDELAFFLARVQALKNFPLTAPHLPQIEHLKEVARKRVQKDAKEIEDMIEQTSQFDKIDTLLEAFEKAIVLNEFISQEVESRLRPLKRLRRKKEIDVDKVITEMIEKNDFSGLSEFLKPLSESKDQIRNKRFKESIETTAESLKVIENKLKKEFDGRMTEEKGQNIACYLKILEQANNEIGEYMCKPILNPGLGFRLQHWKGQVNEKFCRLQQLTQESIRIADFRSVTERNKRTTIITNCLGKYLTRNSEYEMNKSAKSFSALKNSIQTQIDKFIKSSFIASENIEKILRGLKTAAMMDGPIFNEMSQLYNKSTKDLMEKVTRLVETIKRSTEDARCYDDSITIIKHLLHSLDRGLKDHLPQDLVHTSEALSEAWIDARKSQELVMNFDQAPTDIVIRELVKILDNSAPSSNWWQSISQFFKGQQSSSTYERLKGELADKIRQMYCRGHQALERREFVTLSESLDFLKLTDSIAGKHGDLATEMLAKLKLETIESFQSLCQNSHNILQAEKCREFEALFDDFRGFVLNISCLMDDTNAVKSFNLTNQLVYDQLRKEISLLQTILNGFDFRAMKQKIENVRRFGGFIADKYSIFYEEIKCYKHVESDKWLDDLNCIISKYFQNGRDLKRIKYYAILGVPPSASETRIKRAYKKKCLTSHPDKCKDKRHIQEWKDKFLMIKKAYEELSANILSGRDCSSNPFDEEVRSLGEQLRETTRKSLNEQHYEHIETLLYKLGGIEVIECLVKPNLSTEKIQEDIINLVKNHVQKIRTEVDTNWSERKYQDLNYNIKDLKMMEDKFKSYPIIFSTSWNTGIINKVELEIEDLGKYACSFLQDKKMADDTRNEFRRCFMRMGTVLVELPEFKDYTKKVMSDVLESCLNSNWGYSFVFELGLSLQKGGDIENDYDEAEIRIAQTLVSEFQHFNEVITMVWNEETIQKPPEETIRGIRGQCLGSQSMKMIDVNLNSDALLHYYFEYDSAYISFLAEYLKPEADIKALVRKIIGMCQTLKPISCDSGFGANTKHALPSILAGIFAVFTIVKSGESYNRVEQDANGCAIDANKLLIKPHNIQVLTLLCMFGCGTSESSSLKSQLMQIRTGEGKSMILGAAAVVFGLLDFRVRCVCYSEYLSNRDYELFCDVFDYFELLPLINYSKITSLSEERTAEKGDIRGLTLSLLHGTLKNAECLSHGYTLEKLTDKEMSDVVPMAAETDISNTRNERKTSQIKFNSSSISSQKIYKGGKDEIMLVDEVDVFFGAEFYGQTYNQVAQMKEPEVAEILKLIWETHKQGRKRLRLADIKASSPYKRLIQKIPGYNYLLNNEIALMLDQVRRVDDEPFYHLDHSTDKIGYKVQDTICYSVTYGYRTIFAYLKEADDGNLKDKNATLSQVLTMPISCGQFSYANIKPKRILGVSGTLEVMSSYEKNVLRKFGVNQYLFIPSVYGKSNFKFDKVGDGVSIEKGVGDFFYKITAEIRKVAIDKKRAVIVFFSDSKRLNEYTSSQFYRKLGRKKEILIESKNANEKSFVISKAATTGQITLCTSVFGRGTDFFCKDDTLENNGGVHIIQTFLSTDMSEEIQIQGRTARQGKQGSYELILLDEDLENNFDIKMGSSDKWPRRQFYEELCNARKEYLEGKYAKIETNLSATKTQDKRTHEYFDALLNSNSSHAKNMLKDMYLKMKKAHVGQMELNIAFAIDITGSMTAYKNVIASTMQSLLMGSNSILTKLKTGFPDTEFTLRVAILGFRDIDDGNGQFHEMCINGTSHFSENMYDVIHFINNLTNIFSGGADIAEDHLGAIKHCLEWNSIGDWEGSVKALVLLTDAPTHEYVPGNIMAQNMDSYSTRHPLGLTVDSVVDELIKKEVDLFVCSFDPIATAKFEDALGKKYSEHPSNDDRGVVFIPLVPKNKAQDSPSQLLGDSSKHNIFVLDESGSMRNTWNGVVSVFNKFIQNRRQHQHDSDLVSVVQFDSNARVTCELVDIINTPDNLTYSGGGTRFQPATASACSIARKTPPSYKPVIVFMSDGMAGDWASAANLFATYNKQLSDTSGFDLELHVVGFGGKTDTTQLQAIARASPKGQVHTASGIDSLSNVFVEIAGGGDAVASVLETEISKRISNAVTDRVSAEYLG